MDEPIFSSETHFWRIVTIITSTLSYLVNLMRYTIVINKHSISFTGSLVIFLSVLFRLFSFLILMFFSVLLIFWTLNDPFFLLALLFLFLLVQDGTSLFFSHHDLHAKSLTGYLLVFWTSIVGRKKYVYCFSDVFCKKKVMCKFNLSKIMLPLGIAFKLLFYFLGFAISCVGEYDFGFNLSLIGSFSELLSHFFSFVYLNFCHVWKDILPTKAQKRNLKIFSSELEIISDKEENIELLNRNQP
jgi:hypothetical protein